MAELIKIRRSQLGRVRGLGAAHEGVAHWWQERVSALALVPLTLWFVASVLSMLGADQAVVAGWIARPFNAVLLLALIGMTFHHAALGLQVVWEDYIPSAGTRTAAILATKGLALLLGLLAALAVLKLAVAGIAPPAVTH
jgi:succinate dehydrogenase / fumarate reductase membrane anchor subunit